MMKDVRTAILFTAWLCVGTAIAEEAYAPQPENELKRMIKITWSRGPDLPQGFQDSAGGVINNTLVSVCGFCQGRDNEKKPGMYPRGFLKKVWGLELAHESEGWKELPEFPGVARQGGVAAVVNDVLYYWGGFNYDTPYCYQDGYRFSRMDAGWRWEPLTPLPSPVAGAMMCVMGSKIYLCGGADYDAEAFYTWVDRQGKNERLGARLFVFDTAMPDAGWTRLADCPGTPRWVGAFTVVKGHLYLIGGATGGKEYCTVVDNWAYDPAADAWSRLRDLPVASGNFPAGLVSYKDRFILLGGGYQYAKIANSDGTTRAPYGTPHKHNDKGDYYCDIFVYDTETGLFGTADPMPLNNNLSMTLVHGDEVWMIGGETGGAVIEGVFYGHHPELFLKGKLKVAK